MISRSPAPSVAGGWHSYEPASGHGLAHDPFNSIVGPRPIGWISTVDAGDRRNLAPYSFFNAFNLVPPIVGFCSTGRKETVRNIEATGCFAWNLVSMPLAAAMNASSARVDADADKFARAGLTAAPSRLIKAPRVAQSPVSFECRVTQIVGLRTKEGDEIAGTMIFGEVVMVHIDRTLLENGIYSTAAAQPILRGGGLSEYFQVADSQRFEMHRV